MAHEIEQNDSIALYKEAAWHGLGYVSETPLSPEDARKIAFDWEPIEAPVSAVLPDGTMVESPDHKMILRSDDLSPLSVMGKDYCAFGNAALTRIAEGLAIVSRNGTRHGGGTVQVETAGSLNGGKRVWFLLRGETIEIGNRGDISTNFLMLANSFDGKKPLMAKPVCERVVCANTWRVAMGESTPTHKLRHSKHMEMRTEDLANEIDRWAADTAKGVVVANAMAAQQVNRDTIRNLWADVLLALEGPTPVYDIDETGWDLRKREAHIAALAQMTETFDKESQEFGANLWVATNAATKWAQTLRMESKRTDDATAMAYAKWDGDADEATARIMELGKQLITA